MQCFRYVAEGSGRGASVSLCGTDPALPKRERGQVFNYASMLVMPSMNRSKYGAERNSDSWK